MKKQKPPVVLASIMVVLVSAIFVMVWPRKSTQEAEVKQLVNNMPVTGQSRPSATSEQLKQLAKKDAEQVEVNMDPAAMDRTRPRRPLKPTIFIDEQTVSKPTPNESSLESQWYRDHSKSSGK